MIKGNKHSEETKKKMSLHHRTKRGYPPPMEGKKLSEEAKKKIGDVHRGTKRSEETKRKMSFNHWTKKGFSHWSKRNPDLFKEHIEKLREINKGNSYCKDMSHSEETKRKISEAQKGEKSYNWKGGRQTIDGYVYIYKPSHPFCTKRGHVLEHRLVIEKQIERYLQPGESGHHINKIRNDNRLENLMAFSSESAHFSFEKWNKVNPFDIIFNGRNL